MVRQDNLKFSVFIVIIILLIAPLTIYSKSWKWIAFGDTRNNKPEHREVLQAIMANTPDYKFIINIGDVVDHGEVLSEWEDWHATTVDVLGSLGQDQVPPEYMSAPGNHDATETEAGLTNWNSFLPGQTQQFGNEGKFFTFDYENARFIIMDSDKSSITGTQLEMMKEAIENNPLTWLFAITHRPIFEFGNYSSRDDLHDAWGVPLYNHGCDIIFFGHNHFYLRTKKLKWDGNINPPLDPEYGMTEVITANGGASLREVNPDKDGNGYIVETYIEEHGYTELTVEEDTLRLRHILKDGTVFDEEIFAPNPKTVSSFNRKNNKTKVNPSQFQLFQNYPNPFNPGTKIKFSIPITGHISLKIFDVRGHVIKTLADGSRAAGTYQLEWDGHDLNNIPVPSGIYLLKMESGQFLKTRKVILVR